MQFLPLTKVLSYEFSAVMGVLLGYTCGLAAISQTKRGIPFKDVLLNLEIIFLAPLIISVFSTLVFSVCPVLNGLNYYFVITLPAIIIGYSLGLTVSKIITKGTLFYFTLIFILILIEPLLEFYFYPQIFTYNLFYGYFPGALYDEYIPITGKLILYRFIGIVLFGTAAYFVSTIERIDKFITGLILAVGLSAFFVLKPSIGFAAPGSKLKSELGGVMASPNINVYYDSRIAEERAYLVGFMGEYYYQSITGKLGVALEEPITAYVFKTDEQKSNLMGARNVDVSKPWRSEIFLTIDDYDATLEHELVHAAASAIGVTPLKVADNINFAMIEGLAMALEDNYNSNEVHYMAFLADSSGYDISIKELFGGFSFLGNTSSISYIYAGSFIKYLADNYGVGTVAELYGDTDFRKLYGKDLAELEREYFTFLRSGDYEFNKHKAQLYFGSNPIFKRVCPRDVASRTRLAWDQYNAGAYAEAEHTFKELYDYSRSPAALWGYVNILKKTMQLNKGIECLTKEISEFEESSQYYRLMLLLGDVHLLSGNKTAADSIFMVLMNNNPEISYYNLSFIRKLLGSQYPQAAKAYLSGNRIDKFTELISVNSDSLVYETVPAIINSAIELGTKYEDFKGYIIDRLEVTDEKSGYAAYVLSQYAAYWLDFETAEELAELSLQVKPQSGKEEIFKQNYELMKWLNANNEEFAKLVKHDIYE